MRRLLVFALIILSIAYFLPDFKLQEIEIDLGKVNFVLEIDVDRSRECRNAKNYNLEVDTDLRTRSYLIANDYDKMLLGTNLYGLGTALEEAENTYNINGLYLMGLACLESDYGRSGYAINRNNLVGWGAYDSDPNKAHYFESKNECILSVSSKLKNWYLTENGMYFNGYTARDVDVRYCTDKEHADKIIRIVKERRKVGEN